MSNNTIVIIGRLGSDPEQKGSAVKLNIAVDRPGKKDGNKVTDWFTVWLHDKQAEIATQYLTKGKLVSVAGRMQCNKTPDGQYFWAVNASSFQMLSSVTQGDAAPVEQPAASQKAKPRPETETHFAIDDDELPPF